jgi:16S rRNA A1518/A1519 N6-dimethyltransferase RsmA/KsgA/DIM1 with predicted DNA glycosylase/AP lyase activity
MELNAQHGTKENVVLTSYLVANKQPARKGQKIEDRKSVVVAPVYAGSICRLVDSLFHIPPCVFCPGPHCPFSASRVSARSYENCEIE